MKAVRVLPVVAVLFLASCGQGDVTEQQLFDSFKEAHVSDAVAQCSANKLFAEGVSQQVRNDIGHATDVENLTHAETVFKDKIVKECENATATTTTAGPSGATTSSTQG
jgi:hypothetical protein